MRCIMCYWVSGGKELWVRGNSTPSSFTGASRAQSSPYFMYLETSFPSKKGWLSSLTHHVKPGYKSVTFHYHMHGATMGTLRLDAYVGGIWKTLWYKSGQQQKKQGDSFTQAKARPTAFTLPTCHTCCPAAALVQQCECQTVALASQVNLPSGTVNVRFVGVAGSSFTGDMAIDSVVLLKGQTRLFVDLASRDQGCCDDDVESYAVVLRLYHR